MRNLLFNPNKKGGIYKLGTFDRSKQRVYSKYDKKTCTIHKYISNLLDTS